MDDDDQYIITQTHEKREEFFKIRFIPEIEYESGVWVKLNNANPLRSNTPSMFTYVDPKTGDPVTISLILIHKESVYKKTTRTKIVE